MINSYESFIMAAINSFSLLTTQNHVHRMKTTLAVGKWAMFAVTILAIGFLYATGFLQNNPIAFQATFMTGIGLASTAGAMSLVAIAFHYTRSHLRKQLTPENFLAIARTSEIETLDILNTMSKKNFRIFLSTLAANEDDLNLLMNLGMTNPEKLASNLMFIKAPLFERIFASSARQRLREVVRAKMEGLPQPLDFTTYFQYAERFGKGQIPPDTFSSIIPSSHLVESFRQQIQPEIENLQKNLDVVLRE